MLEDAHQKSTEQSGLKSLGCSLLGPAYPFATLEAREAYLLRPQYLWVRPRGPDERSPSDDV